MKRSTLLTASAAALTVLGILMIGLGARAGLAPPAITGIGFLVTAAALFALRRE